MSGQAISDRPRSGASQVARLPDRDAILDAAAEELLLQGLGDATLRSLGRAIGVSARMLVYHFESKEGFLRAVLERIGDQGREWIAPLLAETRPGESPSALLDRAWRHLSQPHYLRLVRLYAEMNARELSNPDAYGGMSDRARNSWFALVAPLIDRYAPDPADRPGLVALIYAAMRGFQLDLCGGVEREAIEEGVARLGRMLDLLAGEAVEDAPPAPPVAPPSGLGGWLKSAGGAQTWLRARAVAASPGQVALEISPSSATADGAGLRRDAILAFVGLAAEAGAAHLCDGRPAHELRVEELGQAEGGARASVRLYRGTEGTVLDVIVEDGRGLAVATGRARVPGSVDL